MFTLHKLNDITKIVSMDIQMALRTRTRNPTRCVRLKIGKIPPLKKVPKQGNPGMILQRSQGCDTQLPRIGQCDVNALLGFLVGCLNRLTSGPNQSSAT